MGKDTETTQGAPDVATPDRGPIVGTLALKITLHAPDGADASLPTLDGVKTSIEGWDLSEYGLHAVVTHAEWTDR